MKMRVQIKMITYAQVDIEVERNASGADMEAAIKKQAEREFGECDKIKVVETEVIES